MGHEGKRFLVCYLCDLSAESAKLAQGNWHTKGFYLRGNTWWYRFTPHRGAPRERVSLGTADFVEAIQIADRLRKQASAARREQAGACAVEIKNYLAHCEREGLAAATIEQRRFALQAFAHHCAAASPAKITTALAQRWFDERRGKNPHTAAAYLKIVRWWFRWLIERGKLRADPTEPISLPKLPMKHRKVFLMFERARLFLDRCEDASLPQLKKKNGELRRQHPFHMTRKELKFVIFCALQHGMRKREIIEAVPEWFDLESGLIHITKTATFEPKGRHHRTVPMTDEFRTWLRAEYGLHSPFMLMPKVKHGLYRYRYDFRAAFENYAAALGESITFHDLRRTFGSLLVSRGVSLYKVAKWLGDTLKVAESTYGHLIAQDEQINAAWTPLPARHLP